MKTYPSIPRSTGQDFQEFEAYVFDKLDGSNLRFEWARKSGWYKSGTRTRLFDQNDPVFGVALHLFHRTMAEPIEVVAMKERWDRVIVFTEFWGPKSLGGLHDPDDPKQLTLFDVNPHKKGLLGPSEFLKLFGDMNIPRFLGVRKWTRGFVDQVRRGEINGITDEGVVGKAGDGHKLVMAKAKTQTWIEKILARYGEAEGRKIVDS